MHNDARRRYREAHERFHAQNPSDERSELYLRADQYLSGSDSAPVAALSKSAGRWVRTLHRYEDFWQEHGRCPRENTRDRASLSGSERRLGEWARYQRRFDHAL